MSSETFILLMSDDWSRFPDLGSGFREALSWRIILAQTDLQVVINSSFRADRGPPVMYGPPPCRKRKVRVTGWSAQMYSAFAGEMLLAMMECAALLSHLVTQSVKDF